MKKLLNILIHFAVALVGFLLIYGAFTMSPFGRMYEIISSIGIVIIIAGCAGFWILVFAAILCKLNEKG